jgi:hypothetical protein
VGAALLAACSNDSSGAPAATTERPTTTAPASTTTSSTAPPRPTSTTTTMFDPTSVEGQVEAAYLKSWDVYAEAIYNLELDEKALAEVYADPLLDVLRKELLGRVKDARAAFVDVEHAYDIVMSDSELASVVENMTNHQVLIDPSTKRPVEPDPNEKQLLNFVMKKVNGTWRVTLIQRVTG